MTSQAAQLHGGRIAIVEGDRAWSYRDFDALVDRLASGLAGRFSAGARIGVMMSNCAEAVMLQFALERASLVRVPVNFRYTAHELSTLMEHCGAAAVFFNAACAPAVHAAVLLPSVSRTCVDEVTGEWPALLATPANMALLHKAKSETLATINYTSGTTGAPKGVMLSHGNWSSVYANMLVDRDLRADDVVGYVGPLTHASGAYLAPWFWRGARNIIVAPPTPARLIDLIERERITAFTCVPTFLTKMLAQADISLRDLSSLRLVGYGAEPLPANTLERGWALLGPVLWQNYGQTEAMMTCVHLPPQDHVRMVDGKPALRHGMLGRPYTLVEVVLRQEDGAPAAVGEIGELTVRASHVMQGYWNQPDATAATVRDGWLWTGDLAVADDEGLLRLVGRRKDMLICGGFNIYPGEIESLLTGLDGVHEAAVVARPDPDWGEIAVAFVVLAPESDHDAATLAASLRPLLGIKTPKAWHLVPELPKNGNGKIDKRELVRRDAQPVPAAQGAPA
ncbi:class I adenylate-forming enzyme family protein [Variovorax guangxiensis]|uniref:class I adenylate-forming enzyme family protein n=1 Tax=Variovorax guangxiensis TaxID=1775474 RepID=UPI00138682D9|nr:AMP-binding protein [Variovorax guangxiensis]